MSRLGYSYQPQPDIKQANVYKILLVEKKDGYDSIEPDDELALKRRDLLLEKLGPGCQQKGSTNLYQVGDKKVSIKRVTGLKSLKKAHAVICIDQQCLTTVLDAVKGSGSAASYKLIITSGVQCADSNMHCLRLPFLPNLQGDSQKQILTLICKTLESGVQPQASAVQALNDGLSFTARRTHGGKKVAAKTVEQACRCAVM